MHALVSLRDNFETNPGWADLSSPFDTASTGLVLESVYGTLLVTGKIIFFFVLKKTALGMPDRRFSIIDEKPFFKLNLEIHVHPIHNFRRRWSFCDGSHANQLEQTTHLPLSGGLFEPILEWMGAVQLIAK